MKYDLALELVRGLETVKSHHLANSKIVTVLADLVFKNNIQDLKLLNEVTESLLSINLDKAEKADFKITPQEILEAEVLEKEIASFVFEIRKKLFDSGDIPFIDRKSAFEWLDKYALNDVEIIENYYKSLDIETCNLVYYKIEGRIFLPDSPPGILYKETQGISDYLGIEHPSLIMHILLKTIIIAPKYNLNTDSSAYRLSSGQWIPINTVNLRFRGTLNFNDMREIYELLKRNYQFSKVKQLNAKHLELYRMVNKKQIPQGKGTVSFWKKVMIEWNKKHPEKQYTTWKGVSIAYNRIIDGLQFKKPNQKENNHIMNMANILEDLAKDYKENKQQIIERMENNIQKLNKMRNN